MIVRTWQGSTKAEDADAYESFLRESFLTRMKDSGRAAFQKFQVFRQEEGNSVHFLTLLWFQRMEEVIRFAGEDYTRAVIEPEARAWLQQHDEKAQHFSLRFESEG